MIANFGKEVLWLAFFSLFNMTFGKLPTTPFAVFSAPGTACPIFHAVLVVANLSHV